MKNILLYTTAFFFIILCSACETDFTNPGASTEGDVVTSPDGLELLTRGLHRRWSVGRQSPVYTTVTASGFTTGELRLINPGNISENELSLGGSDLDGSNTIVSNIWEQALITRNEARTVLENIDIITDPQLQNGVASYAHLFAGIANGTLATFFEQVTLVSEPEAMFSTRDDALRAAITDLDAAISAASQSGGYTQFNINALNAARALKARYHNMLGEHAAAIDAANAVDLSSVSLFTYDAVNTNPIAFVSILTNNVFQPVDLSLGLPDGLQPDPSDGRLPFYFADINPDMNDFRGGAFFDGNEDGIPVYVPGEMQLIIAEAQARQGNVDAAIAALNSVLTKMPEDDALGIGAGLPAYSGENTSDAVLDAIYTNRAMELMMSGLRLEDSRRFARPDAERNRSYYPYPNSERDNNPNTPGDPTI